MSLHTSTGAFDQLIGSELCSVTFIWDYYQLLIGADSLSIYSHPKVKVSGKWVVNTDSEYRNVLCGRIGVKVLAIYDDDQQLSLMFEDETEFAISFLPEDRVGGGPESLVFSDSHGSLLVVGDSQPS